RPDPDAGAQPLPRRAARGATAAVARSEAAEPALRRAGRDAAAALPLHRERPGSRHARLRLLGRERAPRAGRPRGRPGRDRLPGPAVKATVLGGGTWGTCFSKLLSDRGHEVTLASNREEDARAIAATGRNPRYASSVDLDGIAATTIADARPWIEAA